MTVLQQMQDLSDKETIRQLAFNTEWHYALDITEDTDEAKYMSLKTLWNFRKKVIDTELDREIFNEGTGKLAKAFKVDTDKQRIDSVHIRSNMAWADKHICPEHTWISGKSEPSSQGSI